MSKIPFLFSILAVGGFLALLSPSVMTALERETTKGEIAIHQRDVDALTARKSILLSERDTAQTETERIKTLQAEEGIKLERAQGALKTAEELRKSVMAEQMRFENIQRDLVATNQVLALSATALRAELSRVREDLPIAQANCESQKVQTASLRLEKESLEDRAAGLRTNIQMLQAQYDQVSKDIQTQKQEYLQNEEAGRKALVSLRKTEILLAQVTSDVTTQTKRNASLEQDSAALAQAVAGATKELSSLKAQAVKEKGALATSHAEVDAARADVLAYAVQLSQLKAEIQAESKRKDLLISDTKGFAQAATEANKRVKDVQSQLAVETETLKALQSDVDAARASRVAYIGQTEQLKMDIAKLRSELSKSKDLVK